MSALLLANGPFLSVLLNTSKKQQKKLLESLTPIQEKVLIEIFTNLRALPHNAEDSNFIKAKTRFLNRFLPKVPIKNKRAQLRRFKTVHEILERFKGKLLALL